jgi:hypothetical protein
MSGGLAQLQGGFGGDRFDIGHAPHTVSPKNLLISTLHPLN